MVGDVVATGKLEVNIFRVVHIVTELGGHIKFSHPSVASNILNFYTFFLAYYQISLQNNQSPATGVVVLFIALAKLADIPIIEKFLHIRFRVGVEQRKLHQTFVEIKLLLLALHPLFFYTSKVSILGQLILQVVQSGGNRHPRELPHLQLLLEPVLLLHVLYIICYLLHQLHPLLYFLGLIFWLGVHLN